MKKTADKGVVVESYRDVEVNFLKNGDMADFEYLGELLQLFYYAQKGGI